MPLAIALALALVVHLFENSFFTGQDEVQLTHITADAPWYKSGLTAPPEDPPVCNATAPVLAAVFPAAAPPTPEASRGSSLPQQPAPTLS